MKIDLFKALGIEAEIFMGGEELRLWNEQAAEHLRPLAEESTRKRMLSWLDSMDRILD